MPSTPLTDAIVALTTYANTVTGESDATLSAAVETLIDGYGSGGIDANDIAMRTITGDIVLNTATEVKNYAFVNAQITSVSSSTVTKVGTNSFDGCAQMTSVSFPNATTIGSTAFAGCSSLTSVSLPKITTVNSYAFSSCTSLVTLALPGLTGATGSQLTRGCTLLERVDLGKTVRVDGNAVDSCPVLTMVVLRKSDAIATLNNISAFASTPFASDGTGGTLYVPQDLISSYQSASNWSTILGYANNQIKSIESTHTDPTAPIDLTLYYADGTPIE